MTWITWLVLYFFIGVLMGVRISKDRAYNINSPALYVFIAIAWPGVLFFEAFE